MITYLIGLSAGLVPALSTGPVFLTLLQHSIDYGFNKTIFFIIGVALTDSCIILFTWFGLSQLSQASSVSNSLILAGGLVLVLFGAVFIFRKDQDNQKTKGVSSGRLQAFGLFSHAVMLNGINPVIWGFWAAISNYAIVEFHDTTLELIFFAGVLNMIWITDLLKAYYAQKLKKYLNDKIRKMIRIGIGLVLVIIGLKLIVDFFIT